jgi:hypothetical protein
MVRIRSSLQACHRTSHLRRPARGVSEAPPDCVLHITDPMLVQPWGRIVPIRADLQKGAMSEAEGGTGIGEKFWAWSEEQVKPYL